MLPETTAMLFGPSHTFASVAQELVEGLENGTIYLDESEGPSSAANWVSGPEANSQQLRSSGGKHGDENE